ncbi:MAG: glycosyltransferase [Gemmatimonadetes bacterium]|nr:glycosyltransferase [Gemmatimonadota bacterium]
MTGHWLAIGLALAWCAPIVLVVWRFRDTRSLDEYPPAPPADAPLVSVIIPARNEAPNIARCLRSVLASAYPALEVIVVDDHSSDGTGDIARAIAAEDAAARRVPGESRASRQPAPRVRVIPAPDLAPGWFGKQWACQAGAQVATGPLLCFTDADTSHGPELIPRSVNAVLARGADLFTVAGRQEMVSFWEKVVQPSVFALLLARYGGLEAMSRSTRPLDKIANGQFILVRREPYERIGGHAAVRGHVSEDLRLAQVFTEQGLAAHMLLAREHLSTRMYTSLDEIRRGWGKNLFAGGRDTLPLGPITSRILPFIFPLPALVPLVPTVILVLALLGVLGTGALWFGVIAGAVNLLFWIGVYAFSGLNPLWGLSHPLASVVFSGICAEAAWKGSQVEWKGRRYESS